VLTSNTVQLKKTALYEVHKKLGAKIVPFAGFEMPLYYTSLTEEHLCVRKAVGVFDVSHMGEFEILGEKALELVQKVTINNAAKLEMYQAQYSAMCTPKGGIIDDILVYHFPEHYFMVVNAANIEKDFNWIKEYPIRGAEIRNISDQTTLLAVQGPKSLDTLQKLTDLNLSAIPYYRFSEGTVAGVSLMISRTGYTGELGFELFTPQEHSISVWEKIMDAGKEYGIKPIGLGARDSLRMEKAYLLYGTDMTEDNNPFEAGLGWITKLKKRDFIGRNRLAEIHSKPLERRFTGFVVKERGIPRKGYKLYKDGISIGEVTSGIFSPSRQEGIGLGYVSSQYAKAGTDIQVEIREKYVPAEIVKTPFV